MLNLLIFLDNLVQSEQGTHPGTLTVLSQKYIDFINHSRPLIRKVKPQDLANTHCELDSGNETRYDQSNFKNSFFHNFYTR